MTTPPNTLKLVAVYALGYALTIVSLLLDIRHGGALFTLIGFVGSIVITTHILYRAARAMAFSPTAVSLQTVPVSVTSGGQRLAA